MKTLHVETIFKRFQIVERLLLKEICANYLQFRLSSGTRIPKCISRFPKQCFPKLPDSANFPTVSRKKFPDTRKFATRAGPIKKGNDVAYIILLAFILKSGNMKCTFVCISNYNYVPNIDNSRNLCTIFSIFIQNSRRQYDQMQIVEIYLQCEKRILDISKQAAKCP